MNGPAVYSVSRRGSAREAGTRFGYGIGMPNREQEIKSYCDERVEWLIEVLSELTLLDAPSGDVARVAKFVAHYRTLLEEAGCTCQEYPSEVGPHLFGELHMGELRPTDVAAPPVVLVGHSDTVWPSDESDRRPPERKDGRLYGPGTYDMRGGLCVALCALSYVHQHVPTRARRVQVFVAADEEIGSGSAHPVMNELIPPEATAFVLEPPVPGGAIKTERKGVGLYTLDASGRRAHAGVEPEKGASAIHALARYITRLLDLAEPDRGVTINVGTVSGGTSSNMVAGEATCGIDLRFERQQDGERLDRAIRELVSDDPRVELRLSGGLIFPTLEPTARNREATERALRVAERMGFDIGRGKSGGGSDGSYLSARGCAVLDGLGMDGGGAHALDEHVRLDNLAERAAFLTALLVDYAETP